MTIEQVKRILGEEPKEWIIESQFTQPGTQGARPVFYEKTDKFGVVWTERKESACRFKNKAVPQSIIDNLARMNRLPTALVAFLTEVISVEGEMPEGLKCCPFCGGPARKECRGVGEIGVRQSSEFVSTFQQAIFFVECGDCHCYTREFSSEDAAIEAWNRRDHPANE